MERNKHINSQLIQLITHFEGLHDGGKEPGFQPQMCPAGIWTEGYGHAMIVNGEFLKGIENKEIAYQNSQVKTLEDAKNLLTKDLDEIINKKVESHLKVILPQHRMNALISHTYNCGVSQMLYYMINTGARIEEIESFWTNKYITAGGKAQKGLIFRRKVEFNFFATGELKFDI